MPRPAFLLLMAILAGPAFALPPDQVFVKASPSVVMVFAMEGNEGVQGSGVVVAKEKIVTNCHVALIKGGKTARRRLVVRHQEQALAANLLAKDVDFDTCLLGVPTLQAVPIKIANMRSLKIGQHVFAIGAPSGLDLTLTDGLISSLRAVERTQVIQTSAPISPGSSGGGLFDENGDLVGITSFGIGGAGTGLNFAYQADRILSLISLAQAIGADYQPLAESAQASLRAADTDRASLDPQFPSIDAKGAWITEMSIRLNKEMPDTTMRTEFLKTLYYEAQRAGLDPQMVLAVIDKVSGFQKYKVAAHDAVGFMQVRRGWVDLIGSKDNNLLHLRTNLRFGCTLLRYFLDIERGDLFRALTRYHEDLQGKGFAGVTKDGEKFANSVRRLWGSRWTWKG
jgi:hypothetical protein